MRIVCIDRRLEEDLMFKQSLVQHLERIPDRAPLLFVVGSGESEERALGFSGGEFVRQEGELQLHSDTDEIRFERVAREHLRLYVNLFTDAGIACVGFFGADRRILHNTSDGKIAVSNLGAIIGNMRMGVVSVLRSTGRDVGGNLTDLHPIRVCDSIQQKLSKEDNNHKGHIVLLVNNVPGNAPLKISRGTPSSWVEIEASGLSFDEPIRRFAQTTERPFYVSAIADLGGVS